MEYQTLETLELGGLRVFVRSGTSDRVVAEDNLIHHSYEKRFPICEGECWLDVGGYIGTFALRVLQVGGRVLSCEPDPNNLEMYKKNITENEFSASVLNTAVVAHPVGKEITFYRNEYRGNLAGSSTVNRWKRPRPCIQVPCLSFSEVLSQALKKFRKPVCVKLDCEGAEIEILERLTDHDANRIKKLVLEYHFGFDKSLSRLRNIISRLERQGLDVWPEHKIPVGDEWKNFRKITMQIFAQQRETF